MTRLLEDTNSEKYFIRIVKQNELIIKSKGQKDTIKAQKSGLYDSEDYILINHNNSHTVYEMNDSRCHEFVCLVTYQN